MFAPQVPSQASATLKVESVATSRIRKKTKPTGCESEDTPQPPIQDPEETTLLGWVSHFLIHCSIQSFRARTPHVMAGWNPACNVEGLVHHPTALIFNLIQTIIYSYDSAEDVWIVELLVVYTCSVLIHTVFCSLSLYSCSNESPLGCGDKCVIHGFVRCVPPPGYFMYIEASLMRPGHKARLLTSDLRGSSFPQCLIFYYHMYGSGTGILSVLLRHGDRKQDALLWRRRSEQSISWMRAMVDYQCDVRHQVHRVS